MNTLECKIARSVGKLTKLKTILPKQNLLQLYYTLVHSHLTYGISIWGSTYPSHLQKLQKLQSKALKAICNAPYRSPAKPLYAQLNILQIEDVYKYEIAKFMFNFNKTLAPSLFSNFFQKSIKYQTEAQDYQRNRIIYIFLDIVITDYNSV